jgi:WD40 repeat protein
LAAATEEKIIRLFDLAADESYNISLASSLGDVVKKDDKVSCVSFSPIDRFLAAGTQLGLVAIWKFLGPPRDVSSSKVSTIVTTAAIDWEVIQNNFICFIFI